MRFTRVLLGCTVAVICATGIVFAKPVVRLQLSGDKIQTIVAGGTKFVPLQAAGVLKSGDRVRYNIEAVNAGDRPAIGLATIGPIPKRMKYVAGSARADGGSLAEYSVDGRHWSAKPVVLVRTLHGIKARPADPSAYVSIRWIAKRALPPKATVHYAYEVVVR